MKLYILKKTPKFDFEKGYSKLPKSRREKVDKLANQKDKIVSAYEYFLIAKVLKLDDGQDFSYSPNGRPYVPNKMDFSISNSCALCVVFSKNGIVGVDGEFVKKYDPSFAKMICNKNEIEKIERAKDKDREFTILFTKKESTLKSLDLNINNDLKDIIGDFKYKTFEKIVSGNRFFVSICERKNSKN